MQEAQGEVKSMMKSLDDKFSRYLSPSQLQSTIDAAQGKYRHYCIIGSLNLAWICFEVLGKGGL